MGVIQQILQLPFAYVWLPATVFVVVGGAIYWLTRQKPALAEAAVQTAPAGIQPMVAAPKAKDQRGAHRRQGNPVQVHVAFDPERNERIIGSVLDRSVGGMRLCSYEQIDIGTVVSIRPTSAGDIVPWVELEIRSCRPSTEMPDQYEHGCQYVKSPPYSIQLLFG